MDITIEFFKEFEVLDEEDQYLSRWSASINIQRLDKEKVVEGFPVFFVSKEGALKNEANYLNYE